MLRRSKIVIVVALFACAIAAIGQNIFGSLVGTVTDSANNIVPLASVTLTNINTNEVQNATADGGGSYRFVNLKPGKYRISAQHPGFKRFVRDNITVEVDNTVHIDVALELGAVEQTVEVTEETPLLQPETSSLGQVVETRKVNELPLNGRNVLNLVALVPSVVPQGQSQGNSVGKNPFAAGNYQIGGGIANQSAAFYDGVPINNAYLNGIAIIPTQDALQEFKVQTNNLSPEFGRFGGGVINLASKSGSNAVHGAAYEYLRNKVLNANTFFNNASGVGRPPFTQNQFGVNVGGPLMIPKVYDGRNKTFFFFAYEGFRQRVGSSSLFTLPQPEWRTGDFSNLRDASGNLIPIYDPTTSVKDPNDPTRYIRAQFPGNIIPASRLDPTARILASLWPNPTLPGQAFTHLHNYATNASAGGDTNQINARLDHEISDKQHIFGRYTRYTLNNLAIDPFKNGAYPGDVGTPEGITTHHGVIDDIISLSPSTILDLRAGVMRENYARTPATLGYDLTKLGWPAYLNAQIPSALRTLPNLCVSGITNFCGQETGSVIAAAEDTASFTPSLTKISGRHTWKFGGELRLDRHNYAQTNTASGIFNFDQGMTTADPIHPNGGYGFASYMLGYGSGGGAQIVAPAASSQFYRAVYAADTFQMSKRLTLNIGLRYEQPGPWKERYDRMTVFLPNAENPLASTTGLPLKGRLGFVKSPDHPARTRNNLLINGWAPRLGLAYKLDDKTVIRTGYGIFWLPNNIAWAISPHLDIVNAINTNFVASVDGGVTPFDRLSNPFPHGILQPPGRTADLQAITAGHGINSVDPGSKYGYAQQWNFDIQRELVGGVLLDVAYAGSRGVHLPVGWGQQLDQLPDQYLSLGTALKDKVPNPFYGQIQTGALAEKTITRGQLLRPYPQYDGVSLLGEGIGNTIYHSLQVKVEKRFASGSSFLLAYTFSKNIGDVDTITGWLESGGTGGGQDNNNLRADRSVSSFDVPHRLVASYIYDLPVGRGRKLWGTAGGFANKLISGWGVQGVTTYQTGFPLHFRTAQNLTNSYGGGSRPNSTGKSAALSGSPESRLNRWFDTSQITQPAAFTFGNVGRVTSDVRAAGIRNWDFSLIKNTSIRENLNLQFRAEFFNLFNTPQFGFPGQTLGNPDFGVVSSTVNDPRLVQFALRLTF